MARFGSLAPRLKQVRGPETTEPGYVYHATNADRIGEIMENGKLKTHKPWEGTDQNSWPDGSTQKRNYFTPTAQNTWQFAPEEGTPVLLRMKRSDHPIQQEKGTSDLYSTKDVPAEKLEVLTGKGWERLLGAAGAATGIGAAAALGSPDQAQAAQPMPTSDQQQRQRRFGSLSPDTSLVPMTPQMNPQAQQSAVAQAIGRLLGNVTGVSDAMRAARGQMTPEQQRDFAIMGGIGAAAPRAVGAISSVAKDISPAIAKGVKAITPESAMLPAGTAAGREAYRQIMSRGHGGAGFGEAPSVEEQYVGDLAGGSPPTGKRGWSAPEPGPAAQERDPVADAIRKVSAANQGPSSGAYRPSAGSSPEGMGGVRYSIDPAVAKEWNAAGISTPDFIEGNPAGFKQAILRAKAGSPFGAAVHARDDYSNMRTFMTPDQKAGFALEGDDIVSVFNGSQGGFKNIVAPMLDLAKSQGGRTLDAFDTVLPHLYARSGFKPVARFPFDERFQPPDWDKEAFKDFNGGRPDGVMMVYDPSHDGSYIRGSGQIVQNYDQGKALQQAEKNRIAAQPPEEQGTQAGRDMYQQIMSRNHPTDMPSGQPAGTWGDVFAGFPLPDYAQDLIRNMPGGGP